MPGVIIVRDGDFIGVTAPSEELATRAAATIKSDWNAAPQPSSKNVFEYLRNNPAARESSNASPKASSPTNAISATYNVAYIAHAPLQPRAALAEWSGDKLTVWTGTQRPFGVREELAAPFHIPHESVHVLLPDIGSGYGGKHSCETLTFGMHIARATKTPEKVLWVR